MKLYYNPLSRYSQKVLIAFYEKQVEFEPIVVNVMTPESRAAYEQIYPLGKIPLFQNLPSSSSIWRGITQAERV